MVMLVKKYAKNSYDFKTDYSIYIKNLIFKLQFCYNINSIFNIYSEKPLNTLIQLISSK